MKPAKTLAHPLKATLIAFAFASVSFADPVNYYWVGYGIVNTYNTSVNNTFCLDDGTRTNFIDGNTIVIPHGSTDIPEAVQPQWARSGGYINFEKSEDMYGLIDKSGGGRWINGSTVIKIGAGGYQSASNWGGGRRLTARRPDVCWA